MTDKLEMPSEGGSYLRDKNGRLRRTEEPTQPAAAEPAEAPPITPADPAGGNQEA